MHFVIPYEFLGKDENFGNLGEGILNRRVLYCFVS